MALKSPSFSSTRQDPSVCYPAEGHLGCYRDVEIVNQAVRNMAEQISVEWDVESFGHMPAKEWNSWIKVTRYIYLYAAENSETTPSSRRNKKGCSKLQRCFRMITQGRTMWLT